jgi:hypothetical protein
MFLLHLQAHLEVEAAVVLYLLCLANCLEVVGYTVQVLHAYVDTHTDIHFYIYVDLFS